MRKQNGSSATRPRLVQPRRLAGYAGAPPCRALQGGSRRMRDARRRTNAGLRARAVQREGASSEPMPRGVRLAELSGSCVERQSCSDRALHERLGHGASDRVDRPPARAVRGQDATNPGGAQRLDRWLDARFEQSTGQMKAAEKPSDAGLPGQTLSVTQDVDRARMRT